MACTEKPECSQVLIDATRPGEIRYFFQELDQKLLAEEIFYELGIEIRQVMKLALAIEKTFTHDPMTMGIPLQKVSCGVDGEDGATGCPRSAVLHS